MKKQCRNVVVFLSIFVLKNLLYSDIKVKSFLDKNKIFIGDIVRYTINIEHSEKYKLDSFEIGFSTTQALELIKKETSKARKLRFRKDILEKINLYFLALQVGKHSVEEVKLNFSISNSTETKTIVLPKKEVEIISFPKPKNVKFDGEIVDIVEPIWYRNYWGLIFLLLCVAVGVIIYLVKKKQTVVLQEQEQVSEVDIKELALKKLDELWAKDYISKNLIKEFYLELTEIVRDYIGKKNNINALELTTDELYCQLKNIVDKKYNLKLKSFLETADLSKFAKYVPDIKQIKVDFDTARELIE